MYIVCFCSRVNQILAIILAVATFRMLAVVAILQVNAR